MSLGQMEPTRPMVLAERTIERLQREGMDVVGTAV